MVLVQHVYMPVVQTPETGVHRGEGYHVNRAHLLIDVHYDVECSGYSSKRCARCAADHSCGDGVLHHAGILIVTVV